MFTVVLGKGTLSCAYNTHHIYSISPSAYPNHLTGKVCNWFVPNVSQCVTHMMNDQLDRFAASSMMGLQNSKLTIITAYRPVCGKGRGLTTVANQHRKVLGNNVDPHVRLLFDFQEFITPLIQKGRHIILGIGANKSIPMVHHIFLGGIENFIST